MTPLLWLAHRPSSPRSLALGEQLGEPFTATTRQRAELLAVARHGRPVIVVRCLGVLRLGLVR